MADIEIKTNWGMMPAYVARAAGEGPWPGVVVIHDAFGAGENLQRHADWLADCGYLVVAPNLLYWSRKFNCLRAVMKDIAARKGRSFDEIEAARAWLAKRADCTGRQGVIGFCMGGCAFCPCLLAPTGGRFAVAAPNYGQVPKDADTFFDGACPIVGSFGRRDPDLDRRGAKTRDARFVLNSVEHDVKLYPDTSHGFPGRSLLGDKLPLPCWSL